MQTRSYSLHRDGPALWPAHKPLAEVLSLRDGTPEIVWQGTYQGNPQPPEGTKFRREWWRDKNRYDATDEALVNSCLARWQSWDTGFKDKETSAFTACTTGELWPDYRLAIRRVYRERLLFPDLPDAIEREARWGNSDGKLRGVVIEDKASGISAIQTLGATAEPWLRKLLTPFEVSLSKEQRADLASVPCKQGGVLLPHPDPSVAWLLDFEDEWFGFPQSTFKDQVDSAVQLIIYLEHYLSAGFAARQGRATIQ